MKLKKLVLFILLILMIGLVACSGASPKDKISDHLEKTVDLEKVFEERQADINALEKKDQDLYGEIIQLSEDEFDQVEELSDEAIEVIEKRQAAIDIEKESIEASKAEFQKMERLIGDLEEEKISDKAKEMYDVMIKRYDAYEKLYKAYVTSLEQEEKLYVLFKKKDVTQEELATQITEVNTKYEEILKENDAFNVHTISYNTLKKEFYTIANIEVIYEDELEVIPEME